MQAAADASGFLGQLESTAKELGVLKGALSRHLLPYDANTDINDQSNRRPMSPRSAAAMKEKQVGGRWQGRARASVFAYRCC